MIFELLPVLLIQDIVWVGFAVFVRVSAVLTVLPAFGDQPVPMRVRLVLALMFTMIVAPSVGPDVGPRPSGLVEILGFLAPEVITGLFFGILLRFFVLALQIAGSIAAQSTSLSQIFGGTAGADPQPAIGHVLVVAGTALAALMGLHIQAAIYLIHSYTIVPLGTALGGTNVVEAGVSEVSKTFGLGFTLAAPFLIASLVYNVVLGVINKAMPQLMVSFVGAPAITAGGLLILLFSAPFMLSIWFEAFSGFMDQPFGR